MNIEKLKDVALSVLAAIVSFAIICVLGFCLYKLFMCNFIVGGIVISILIIAAMAHDFYKEFTK